VGADISLPYLRYCQERELYKDLVRCDVRRLPFKEKSFDVVLLLQLVEHLTKEEGLKLIDEAQKTARKQVIIGTPVGFLELGFHLSGWQPDEFRGLGYKVSGHGIRIPVPNKKLKGFIIQLSRFSCLFPFTYRFPKFAYQMVAVKRLGVGGRHG
jgi:ubiquinone/menaquinone biosynthesis C-methylase UbiE